MRLGCTLFAVAATCFVAACTSRPVTLIAASDNSYATGRYYLAGDAILFPQTISDNDEKTYLAWSDQVEIPAVFAINPDGDEMLVNGHMRDGVFVIDEVHSGLRLRLGKAEATATRAIGGLQ